MQPGPGIEPSDEELVVRVHRGDISAFDTLVIRYKERLYGVIYNMTSNHEDTNDLLMEVFDKAYRSLSTFKGESSFYTWVYRIALNRTFNHLEKRKKHHNNLSLNDLDIEDMLQKEFLDSSATVDPERQAQLKELQKRLNESLQKLSTEHRAVVVLFDIEGMSHAEIGRILNCSEGTVRSRLHYAHKHLQKSLENYLNH
jgi:RNA polymerase sigma-70 factor (ECF subfamily)